jgi:hypothetical protein
MKVTVFICSFIMNIHKSRSVSIALSNDGVSQSKRFMKLSLRISESCCALINIPRLGTLSILRVRMMRPLYTTKAEIAAKIGITVNVKLAPPITALALITNQRSPIGN